MKEAQWAPHACLRGDDQLRIDGSSPGGARRVTHTYALEWLPGECKQRRNDVGDESGLPPFVLSTFEAARQQHACKKSMPLRETTRRLFHSQSVVRSQRQSMAHI